MEIWKDIKGYEGKYQISNLGNVKSLKYKEEKILKTWNTIHGYKSVTLSYKCKTKHRPIHQLVAEAFLNHTPCGLKMVVNHKNFNRQDNSLENLEIVTMRENANKKHIKSTSVFTGVCWNSSDKKWKASIYTNKKLTHLGSFDDEQEASQYYEKALLAINNNTDIIVKRRKYSSSYKGVSWNKRLNKWRAKAYVNGKLMHFGLFENEIDAHNAYQKAMSSINSLPQHLHIPNITCSRVFSI